MKHIWIIGTGGIALATYRLYSKRDDCSVRLIGRKEVQENNFAKVNSNDEGQISDFIIKNGIPDVVIVATGLLSNQSHGPEKTIASFTSDWFDENLKANFYPGVFWCKSLTAHLKRKDAIKFVILSARVGSISDNQLGGWYSYRISKAALNMFVRNTANEWRYKYPQSIILAYHPGTVDTNLSKPFQNSGIKKLFTPDEAAHNLKQNIDNLDDPKIWSGQLIDWRGDIVQP
ncbi:short-chain dehydrogenase [Paraphotobacterium marinum]|uniref:Short-chain dehydrogenase n=1 Tax=Paraphotobacterium marinum TaxID=1755811 RepID=A0A220VGC4_9GAMM|nr:SDR family NAD(P)-dependent oxidoreductase [Paraphotobacterium marinum]ASK79003.1 short-chain dehydrogenase [Paraphotobacterium marinum]